MMTAPVYSRMIDFFLVCRLSVFVDHLTLLISSVSFCFYRKITPDGRRQGWGPHLVYSKASVQPLLRHSLRTHEISVVFSDLAESFLELPAYQDKEQRDKDEVDEGGGKHPADNCRTDAVLSSCSGSSS